jgi:hypothetical protein
MVAGDLGSMLTVAAAFSYRPFILGWVIVSVVASLLLGRVMSAGTRSARVRRARRRHAAAHPDLRTR